MPVTHGVAGSSPVQTALHIEGILEKGCLFLCLFFWKSIFLLWCL